MGGGGVACGEVGAGVMGGDGARGGEGEFDGTPGKARMKISFERPRLSRYCGLFYLCNRSLLPL